MAVVQVRLDLGTETTCYGSNEVETLWFQSKLLLTVGGVWLSWLQ